jgi:hypothetical protein
LTGFYHAFLICGGGPAEEIKAVRLDYSRLEWQLPTQISAPWQVIQYKKWASPA